MCILIITTFDPVACTSSPCPLGSICTINNETRRANCVYTCNVDNGGCDGGNRCVELDLPTCRPGQRCSLTCFRMFIMHYTVYAVYLAVILINWRFFIRPPKLNDANIVL